RRARQPEPQRVEVILQAFAALRAAMHSEARRFVDHQHEPVAVEKPRHHLFGGHIVYFPEIVITGLSARPRKVAPGFPIKTYKQRTSAAAARYERKRERNKGWLVAAADGRA